MLRIVSFWLLISLVGQGVFAQPQENTGPKVATFLDFPPYISDEEPDDGFISVIVKESFALAGIEPDYTIINWRRSFRAVSIGEIDASFSWAMSAERAAMVHISKPLFSTSNELLTTYPDLADWRQLIDIAKAGEKPIICVPTGWKVGAEVQSLVDQNMVQQVSPSHPRFCMELVQANRTNIVYMPRLTALHFLKQVTGKKGAGDANQDIRLYSIPVPSGWANTQHVIFTKDADGLALKEKFDQGLDKLIASGRYAEILERFFSNYPEAEREMIYQKQINDGILPEQ